MKIYKTSYHTLEGKYEDGIPDIYNPYPEKKHLLSMIYWCVSLHFSLVS